MALHTLREAMRAIKGGAILGARALAPLWTVTHQGITLSMTLSSCTLAHIPHLRRTMVAYPCAPPNAAPSWQSHRVLA